MSYADLDTRGMKRARDDREYQDNDPYRDRHNNPLSEKLFVDRLPYNITEKDVRELFAPCDGFVNVQFGNKELRPGEFRTCTITFASPEQASKARMQLQHHRGDGWTSSMLINFVKGTGGGRSGAGLPSVASAGADLLGLYGGASAGAASLNQLQQQMQYLSQLYYGFDVTGLSGADPSMNFLSDTDSLGNPACPTLFVKNFVPEMTQQIVQELFPPVIKIILGIKKLAPGEFRTAYLYFADIPTAISERHRMNGYMDAIQHVPLIINYSKRPQDQIPGQSIFGYAPPPAPVAPPTHYPPAALLASAAPAPSASSSTLSLSDTFDSKGNPATNVLFVDCLPYNVKESVMREIFEKILGFKHLKLGNKELRPDEYRTCLAYFTSVETAVVARKLLQNYKESDWERPMIVNFYK